ncbi:hypothetical protein [Halodesulfovibrio sp.]|uniref:hypothetical protein n=1 Tax=Halodesulfovibrio sp. TaxID=1912772 RepID=UPI0025DC060E|nr:hypothetical protein [Halodesulfovibrio sp.]MCT4626439.1 hypothetical protein [Halodesulfovibrio sp.]
MKRHVISCIAMFGIFLCLTSTGHTQESDDGFSSPINEAELALDAILTFDQLASQDDRFGPFMDFIIGYPERDTTFDHLYKSFFTPALIKAWRTAERDRVMQDCKGEYIDGDLCGLGFNPLSCAQDDPPNGYVYKTQMETDKFILIAAAWKGWEDPTAIYRMVFEENQWRLDGVICADGDRFN